MNEKSVMTKQQKDDRHKASVASLKAAIWKQLNTLPDCHSQCDAVKIADFIQFQHDARRVMERERLGLVVLASLLTLATNWHNPPINQQAGE